MPIATSRQCCYYKNIFGELQLSWDCSCQKRKVDVEAIMREETGNLCKKEERLFVNDTNKMLYRDRKIFCEEHLNKIKYSSSLCENLVKEETWCKKCELNPNTQVVASFGNNHNGKFEPTLFLHKQWLQCS